MRITDARNLFYRESWGIGRIGPSPNSATAIVVIMKITEGNLSFLYYYIK